MTALKVYQKCLKDGTYVTAWVCYYYVKSVNSALPQTEWDDNKPLYSCFRVNLTYGTLRDPVDAACALLFEKITLLVVEAAGPRAA